MPAVAVVVVEVKHFAVVAVVFAAPSFAVDEASRSSEMASLDVAETFVEEGPNVPSHARSAKDPQGREWLLPVACH